MFKKTRSSNFDKSELEVRVSKRTKDLEKRTKELERVKEDLEEAKATLEIKVKARTRELEEVNKSLEEKVKERTKALEKRVNELERFYRLTLSRELKMTELKKEIKKLKGQRNYER